MKHILYNRIVLILALNMMVFNYACNNSTNSDQKSNTPSNIQGSDASRDLELKVGGLYLMKKDNGKYSVAKIIAMDNFSVHLCMYSDEFQAKPTQISSINLNVLIEHAPMDPKGFLSENPELLKIEDVKDAELEGYKIYQEEMRK